MRLFVHPLLAFAPEARGVAAAAVVPGAAGGSDDDAAGDDEAATAAALAAATKKAKKAKKKNKNKGHAGDLLGRYADEASVLEIEVGNATATTDLTAEFGLRDPSAMAPVDTLPFQAQVRF